MNVTTVPLPRSGFVVLALLCAAITIAPAAAQTTTTTFADGAEGWTGPAGPGGSTVIDATGGNPAENLHTVFNDFGITFRNDTNPGFVFDYTTSPTVTISVDVKVEDISFGGPVSRPWLVDLRDLDDPPGGFPWVSVWFKFADISAATHGDWTTFTITIDDTSASDLPAGWQGYGAEGPGGEPMLPADRTFTDVLAGVDQIAFTTLEPGFFFGFTDHDVRLDNLSVGVPSIFADGFESGDTSAWSLVQPPVLP